MNMRARDHAGSTPLRRHTLARDTESYNTVVLGERCRHPVLIGVNTCGATGIWGISCTLPLDGAEKLACPHSVANTDFGEGQEFWCCRDAVNRWIET